MQGEVVKSALQLEAAGAHSPLRGEIWRAISSNFDPKKRPVIL